MAGVGLPREMEGEHVVWSQDGRTSDAPKYDHDLSMTPKSPAPDHTSSPSQHWQDSATEPSSPTKECAVSVKDWTEEVVTDLLGAEMALDIEEEAETIPLSFPPSCSHSSAPTVSSVNAVDVIPGNDSCTRQDHAQATAPGQNLSQSDFTKLPASQPVTSHEGRRISIGFQRCLSMSPRPGRIAESPIADSLIEWRKTFDLHRTGQSTDRDPPDQQRSNALINNTSHEPVFPAASSSALTLDASTLPSRHTTQDPGDVRINHPESTLDDAAVAAAFVGLPPTPPRRNLRERKAAQLQPYTTEMQRYKRRLIRNDWEDAVVIDRGYARALREKRRKDEDADVDAQENPRARERELEEAENRKRRHSHARMGRREEKRSRRALQSLENGADKDIGTLSETSDLSESSGDGSQSSSLTIRHLRRRNRRRLISESTSEAEEDSTANDRNASPSSPLARRDREALTISDDDCSSANSEGSDNSFIVDDMGESVASKVDSGGRDYDLLYKKLKRTMPSRLAKICIADLKKMDQEKAAGLGTLHRHHGNSARSDDGPEATDEVRPGEARKRARRRHQQDKGLFDLQGDPEDATAAIEPSLLITTDSEGRSANRSCDSMPVTTRAQRQYSSFSIEDSASEDNNIVVEESGESDSDVSRLNVWWQTSSSRPKRRGPRAENGDAIDRMLSRGSVRSRHKARRSTWRPPKRTGLVAGYLMGNDERNGGANGERSEERERHKSKHGLKERSHVIRGDALTTRHYGSSKSKSYLPCATRATSAPKRAVIDFSSDSILHIDAESHASPEGVVKKTHSKNTSFSNEAKHHAQDVLMMRFPRRSDAGSGSERTPSLEAKASPAGLRLPQKASAKVSEVRESKELRITRGESETSKDASTHLKQQLEEAAFWKDVANIRDDFGLDPTDDKVKLDKIGCLGLARLDRLPAFTIERESRILLRQSLDFAQEEEEPERQSFESIIASLDISSLLAVEKGPGLSQSKGQEVDLSIFHENLVEFISSAGQWINSSKTTLLEARDAVQCSQDLLDSILGLVPPSSLLLVLDILWVQLELATRLRLKCQSLAYKTHDESMLNHLEEPDEDDVVEDILKKSVRIMECLMRYGLHKSVAALRTARRSQREYGDDSGVFDDPSVSYWICLITFVQSYEDLLAARNGSSFWDLFLEALRSFHKSVQDLRPAIILAENAWFSIFAVCSLSRVSIIAGKHGAGSLQRAGNWALVAYAISLVRVRFDGDTEQVMGHRALLARDNYIRIVLFRIGILINVWQWMPINLDCVLNKVFAWFDLHKLEDLPTDTNHDFPRSLQSLRGAFPPDELQYDAQRSAFQNFLSLLVISLQHASSTIEGDQQQKERQVSRLLSRFSPMRTMPFTTTHVPTERERSALYNHYSLALVYLHLAPSTHVQRLLQIQQCLKMSTADFKSQFVGIRAMMYAGIILQHHALPLDLVLKWFGAFFSGHHGRLEELSRSQNEAGRKLEIARKMKNEEFLLKTALRSIQYIIKVHSLDPTTTFEVISDVRLLQPVWTDKILDSHVCFSCPELAEEVVETLKAYLLRRKAIVHAKNIADSSAQPSEDSQDSFVDYMDDFVFDDDAILNLAGYSSPRGGEKGQSGGDKGLEKQKAAEIKIANDKADATLAQVLHTRLSPAIFRFLNNLFHPDRARDYSLQLSSETMMEINGDERNQRIEKFFDRSQKTHLAQSMLDCWAHCAWILTEDHSLRSWSTYLHYGLEDPRRFVDGDARREAVLRFYIQVLGMAASRAQGAPCPAVYTEHMGEVWGQLLTSLMAPHYTMQHLLLDQIYRLETQRRRSAAPHAAMLFPSADAQTDLVANLEVATWPRSRDRVELSDLSAHRLNVLTTLFINFGEGAILPGNLKSSLFSALTSMLMAMRTHIEDQKRDCTTCMHLSSNGRGQARLDRYTVTQVTHTHCAADAARDEHADYRAFSHKVLLLCREHLGDVLLRGIATDLRKTSDALAAL